MPFEPPYELPADSSELARLVADSRQPCDTRERSLERLMPTIEALARPIASRYRGSSHDEFVAESASIVWTRIHQFDPARGRFEDWCRTVLGRYAIDVWRKSQGPVKPAVGGEGGPEAFETVAIDASLEAAEEIMTRSRELRSVLDRVAWPPSGTVNYFAVLLLQLRWVAARQLTHESFSGDAAWRAELPQLISWLLPWHPREDEARLKPDWPPLERLWAALCPAIRDPAVTIDAAVICDWVAPLLPPTRQLTPDVWNQWVHRAKGHARTRVADEAVWARCFRRLLPDHPRGPAS